MQLKVKKLYNNFLIKIELEKRDLIEKILSIKDLRGNTPIILCVILHNINVKIFLIIFFRKKKFLKKF